MSEGKLYRYESAKAVVTWDAQRCIHAAVCVHRLPAVFDPKAKPWIRPDAADVAALADAVNGCPSGALAMQYADGGSAMDAPDANSAIVTANGPLYLRGKLTLEFGGAIVADTRVALCRCGASQHKPFCDNSHLKSGFQAAGKLPATVAAPADANLAAALAVKPQANGPLQCSGPLTLHGSDGQSAYSEDTFLCRCGGSQNKPYCDGTHRKVGFTG